MKLIVSSWFYNNGEHKEEDSLEDHHGGIEIGIVGNLGYWETSVKISAIYKGCECFVDIEEGTK